VIDLRNCHSEPIKSLTESWIMVESSKTVSDQIARNPVDKRSCPRYPFSPAAEAVDVLADSRINGRLSDIARNGCYMDTISPFASKTDVMLTITRDNQSFRTHARVVYEQIGMGMGLAFTTAEPEQLRQLGRWLGELGGGESSERNAPISEIQRETRKSMDHELREIFKELITILSRKSIISDSDEKSILRKLHK
jgi:hypothetical protein